MLWVKKGRAKLDADENVIRGWGAKNSSRRVKFSWEDHCFRKVYFEDVRSMQTILSKYKAIHIFRMGWEAKQSIQRVEKVS